MVAGIAGFYCSSTIAELNRPMCYQAKDQQERTTSMPLAEYCTSHVTGNRTCFNVQTLWETLDHSTEQVSTAGQEQTPCSLLPLTLTEMTGSQHRSSLVLSEKC